MFSVLPTGLIFGMKSVNFVLLLGGLRRLNKSFLLPVPVVSDKSCNIHVSVKTRFLLSLLLPDLL